ALSRRRYPLRQTGDDLLGDYLARLDCPVLIVCRQTLTLYLRGWRKGGDSPTNSLFPVRLLKTQGGGSDMNDVAGQEIKGYKLEERIGAGGFGAVYRAYQSTIGREVAVKIILPSQANRPDFIRRFEAEAQLIARLEHPYIVPLYDYWREPDGAYLVMR